MRRIFKSHAGAGDIVEGRIPVGDFAGNAAADKAAELGAAAWEPGTDDVKSLNLVRATTWTALKRVLGTTLRALNHLPDLIDKAPKQQGEARKRDAGVFETDLFDFGHSLLDVDKGRRKQCLNCFQSAIRSVAHLKRWTRRGPCPNSEVVEDLDVEPPVVCEPCENPHEDCWDEVCAYDPWQDHEGSDTSRKRQGQDSHEQTTNKAIQISTEAVQEQAGPPLDEGPNPELDGEEYDCPECAALVLSSDLACATCSRARRIRTGQAQQAPSVSYHVGFQVQWSDDEEDQQQQASAPPPTQPVRDEAKRASEPQPCPAVKRLCRRKRNASKRTNHDFQPSEAPRKRIRQKTHVDDWDVVYIADRLGANSSNPIHPSHHLGEWRRVIFLLEVRQMGNFEAKAPCQAL